MIQMTRLHRSLAPVRESRESGHSNQASSVAHPRLLVTDSGRLCGAIWPQRAAGPAPRVPASALAPHCSCSGRTTGRIPSPVVAPEQIPLSDQYLNERRMYGCG